MLQVASFEDCGVKSAVCLDGGECGAPLLTAHQGSEQSEAKRVPARNPEFLVIRRLKFGEEFNDLKKYFIEIYTMCWLRKL